MRCAALLLVESTTVDLCSFFFLLCGLEVKLCRPNAWLRTIFPVPVFLRRLAAPLWVFNLGMVFLLTSRVDNCGDYTGVGAVTLLPRRLLGGRAHCRSLRYAQD